MRTRFILSIVILLWYNSNTQVSVDEMNKGIKLLYRNTCLSLSIKGVKYYTPNTGVCLFWKWS